MFLKELFLSHFRNHTERQFRFGQKTLIIGPNSSGKTNILEAARLLSIFKSFRHGRDIDCIEIGYDITRIRGSGKGEHEDDQFMLELAITPTKKQTKLNTVVRTPSELFGWLPTVLFTPHDLALINEGPSVRRRFIDGLLCQIDRRYLWSLIQYLKVLKQRNALLKDILYRNASVGSLDPWDEQLVQFGQDITEKRIELLKDIDQHFTNVYHTITGTTDQIAITTKISPLSMGLLQALRSNDLRLGSTTQGPHHDDFLITLYNQPLVDFGSRGQWRSVVVALKLLEGRIMYHQTAKRPVYLLDDVFSELDQKHRELIITVFDPSQVIVTTADTEHPWDRVADLSVIELA